MTIAFWNGNSVPLSEVCISPLDRGYLFGDGVYEVMRVYRGRAFALEQHLARLARSLTAIQVQMSTDYDFAQCIRDNIGINQIIDGLVYLQVTRGTAPRTHHYPRPEVAANVLIFTDPVAAEPIVKMQNEGCKVVTRADDRWQHCYIKSINLLPNCMAKQFAVEQGANECVWFDQEQFITEGSATNVFVVSNQTLMTRPLDGRILPGITRQQVLDAARRDGLAVVERGFTKQELLDADEVFVTSTSKEVTPVIAVDGIAKSIGPLTQRCRELLTHAIRNAQES